MQLYHPSIGVLLCKEHPFYKNRKGYKIRPPSRLPSNDEDSLERGCRLYTCCSSN